MRFALIEGSTCVASPILYRRCMQFPVENSFATESLVLSQFRGLSRHPPLAQILSLLPAIESALA